VYVKYFVFRLILIIFFLSLELGKPSPSAKHTFTFCRNYSMYAIFQTFYKTITCWNQDIVYLHFSGCHHTAELSSPATVTTTYTNLQKLYRSSLLNSYQNGVFLAI